ncbi:GAF and ANTAR domain-containing protein [Streptomyces sp. TR06-5]|uniref:GAF and ANTAR domain-containing protein n=1 Tax=unclassified Streptomyces TaxID=2593676 RepID=UPI0039A3E603
MTHDGGGHGRGSAPGDPPDARRLAETLAETLRAPSPRESLRRLCESCLRILPVSGISLSVSGSGADTHTTLCATDSVAARLAEIQYTLGEGPSCQACSCVAPVFVADLVNDPPARRWPLFTAEALRSGAHAVFSVPLGGGSAGLGTLDMYRRQPGPLSVREERVALTVADVATFALVALDRDASVTEEHMAWLADAEAGHEEVHQATGMIMVRLGVDIDEALTLLRARAFAEGRTATELARDIVNRRTDVTGND